MNEVNLLIISTSKLPHKPKKDQCVRGKLY